MIVTCVPAAADWPACGVRDIARKRTLLSQPGMQAAVEVVIPMMPDDIQQPDETSGPATTFIVVDHIDRIRVMPQCAKYRFELSFAR